MKVDLRASMMPPTRRAFSLHTPSGRAAAAVFLLLCIANANIFLQRHRVVSRIAECETAFAAYGTRQNAQEKRLAVLRAEAEQCREGVDFVRSGALIYEFVAAVSAAAGEHALLSRFECGEKQALIEGEADDEDAALIFAEKVGALLCVAKAGLPEIYETEGPGGRRFSLRCTLR